jgi:type II secretory pathway pseudopilin PulG
MFSLTLMAIVSATAVPQILSGLDRARAIAAARYLAQQCGIARFQAVGRARSVALQFTPAGDDYAATMFADGNRNGVRAAEIAGGVDTPLAPRVLLSAAFPGVRIALDPALGLGSDPIRLSGSMLLSFSPGGTATAGTVYVLGRDGTQLAVRVLGVTGRTRVLRYERSSGLWEHP